MTDTIQFGDTEIRYRLRRSAKRKTLAISVAGQAVEVAAPAGLKEENLRPYVKAKAGWILAKLDENRRVAPVYPRQMQSGVSLHYLGRQYLLQIAKNAPERKVKLWRGKFMVCLLEGDDIQSRGTALLKDWYRGHLIRRLEPLICQYARQLGIDEPPFHVRDLGKRWGSCGKNESLYFHWQLARLPVSLLEFVCAHEIVHLKERNHTRAFRRLLAQLVPQHGNLVQELAL